MSNWDVDDFGPANNTPLPPTAPEVWMDVTHVCPDCGAWLRGTGSAASRTKARKIAVARLAEACVAHGRAHGRSTNADGGDWRARAAAVEPGVCVTFPDGLVVDRRPTPPPTPTPDPDRSSPADPGAGLSVADLMMRGG